MNSNNTDDGDHISSKVLRYICLAALAYIAIRISKSNSHLIFQNFSILNWVQAYNW